MYMYNMTSIQHSDFDQNHCSVKLFCNLQTSLVRKTRMYSRLLHYTSSFSLGISSPRHEVPALVGVAVELVRLNFGLLIVVVAFDVERFFRSVAVDDVRVLDHPALPRVRVVEIVCHQTLVAI